MRTQKALGLTVLLVAGCASGGATAVAVRPISDGRPAERTEYLLSDLAGNAVGRVTLVGGGMIRDDRGAEFADISVIVENRGARTIEVPLDELYLTSLGSERLPPMQVNDGPPALLVVPQGERRAFHLRFALPVGVVIDKVRAFQLHWAVAVNDRVPTTRSTAFAAIPSTASFEDRRRGGPEPGALYHEMNDMVFQREETMRNSRGLRVQRRTF